VRQGFWIAQLGIFLLLGLLLSLALSDKPYLLAVCLPLALFLALSGYRRSVVDARALEELTQAAEGIGKGGGRFRIDGSEGTPVVRLANALGEVAARIEGDLTRTRAERNRLDAILRGMGEGIMAVDASGGITLVNPAFRELFSLTEEVEGKPLIEITRHPDLHDTFRDVIATKAERVEELVLRSPGEKTVLTHWVPLIESEKLQGVVVVFHDITDIRVLENMRRDFVANVSHELRTPITIIKGYAETLTGGALEKNPVQASRFVSIILSHAERLAALVGDLLVLSQLESGNLSLETFPVSLQEVTSRVGSLLESKSAEKGITIDMTGVAEAPPALADTGRLEQILVNLLDNAIKYTPAGGSVTMSADTEGNLVKVGVHDTGIGIPSRDQGRIFERFYRVDTARSREQGGTGLGLSIVKHLVQMHGGTVSVKSSGQGSSFYFTLKRALL
jgi:two-component system phosphate regulon sensor histidine kinase PhoR